MHRPFQEWEHQQQHHQSLPFSSRRPSSSSSSLSLSSPTPPLPCPLPLSLSLPLYFLVSLSLLLPPYFLVSLSLLLPPYFLVSLSLLLPPYFLVSLSLLLPPYFLVSLLLDYQAPKARCLRLVSIQLPEASIELLLLLLTDIARLAPTIVVAQHLRPVPPSGGRAGQPGGL